MVQAGQRQDPHQQGLSQAPDAVLKAPHKLLPSSLRPAQALMANWVLHAVVQAPLDILCTKMLWLQTLACMAAVVQILSDIRLLGSKSAISFVQGAMVPLKLY